MAKRAEKPQKKKRFWGPGRPRTQEKRNHMERVTSKIHSYMMGALRDPKGPYANNNNNNIYILTTFVHKILPWVNTPATM